MIKVYQKIVERHTGDCMCAVIASLFETKLKEVPNFKEFGDSWFQPFWDFLRINQYTYDGCIYNRKYSALCTPTHECFNTPNYDDKVILTPTKLHEEKGVGGYFFASVFSPKYFNLHSGFTATHAVVINRDYNIVHDPNPAYEMLLNYPLASVLDYNGIIDVMLINPI